MNCSSILPLAISVRCFVSRPTDPVFQSKDICYLLSFLGCSKFKRLCVHLQEALASTPFTVKVVCAKMAVMGKVPFSVIFSLSVFTGQSVPSSFVGFHFHNRTTFTKDGTTRKEAFYGEGCISSSYSVLAYQNKLILPHLVTLLKQNMLLKYATL